jgi:hypothetical protein
MMHLLSSSPPGRIIAQSRLRQQQAPHPKKKRVVQPSPLNVGYRPSGGDFDSLVGVGRSVTGDFWESADIAYKDFFSAKRNKWAIDITRGSPLLAQKPPRSF